MLKRYEKFLDEFNKKIARYFKKHSDYICCKKGCSACCEVGDYPFTQLEMMYLMNGFRSLNDNLKRTIKQNIDSIKKNRVSTHFFYKCPFLINNLCSVYKYRGITCRTHGLAYLTDNGMVKVPECVNNNLCYSKVHKDNEFMAEPIKDNLSLLEITGGETAKRYKLEFGLSKSLIDWFP
ncbi:MAG: hypothetical protein LUB59_05250 [Candidatus Gastranaerophilales bacterium]|nr:hypothetical protein [Candidatus Gastranaerophilales bacterium]